MRQLWTRVCLRSLFIISLCTTFVAECRGQTPPASTAPDVTAFRTVFVDVTAYSLLPGEGLSTYRRHGSGGAGARGTFSTQVQIQGGKKHLVSITGREQNRQFLADFSVKEVVASQPDRELPEFSQSFNMTDLQPRMIEIGKDADGRVYRINLVPRLVEPLVPKKFLASDLKLDAMTFRNAAVILNDKDYVGSLQMSSDSNSVTYIELPGLARVEFSLTEMTDSKPEGILQDGTIVISHESTMLQIRGVTQGTSRQILEGPYLVFVRWKQPELSLEEARTMAKTQISMLKEQIQRGEISLPGEALAQLEKMADSERPFPIGNGTRQLQKKEIVVSEP